MFIVPDFDRFHCHCGSHGQRIPGNRCMHVADVRHKAKADSSIYFKLCGRQHFLIISSALLWFTSQLNVSRVCILLKCWMATVSFRGTWAEITFYLENILYHIYLSASLHLSERIAALRKSSQCPWHMSPHKHCACKQLSMITVIHRHPKYQLTAHYWV